MLRRWIIRSLALALLTLCVTAWVGSYFHSFSVGYFNNITRSHFSEPGEGIDEFGSVLSYRFTPGGHFAILGGRIDESDCGLPTIGDNTWFVNHQPYNWENLAEAQEKRELFAYHVLGFAWQPRAATDRPQWMIIPLWFPTLLSAGCLWLVWRKPRPTRPPSTTKGFPVEMTAKQ